MLRGIDTLTKATCYIQSESSSEPILLPAHDCSSEHSKLACADLGGECRIERDGYYVTSAMCIAVGAILLLTFVQPTARKLQGKAFFLSASCTIAESLTCFLFIVALPNSAWRVKLDRQG